MNKKGTEFKGFFGGANYKRIASIFGMNTDFYKKGVGSEKLQKGMKALDLGCGPGALSFALAENAHPESNIIGIDISNDQLNYASNCSKSFDCNIEFKNCSMDELPFNTESFDLVMSSMALHETPPNLRRKAINETARVLKSGGRFLLIDWSRPKIGLWGVLWAPFVSFGKNNKDNWYNIYTSLCLECNLICVDDSYISSIARRQVFIKKTEK